MKKYISIVSLAAALGILSCDREHNPDEIPEKSQQKSEQLPSHRTAESMGHSEENKTPESKDTGDDDEPRKDKQHWRVANDSI